MSYIPSSLVVNQLKTKITIQHGMAVTLEEKKGGRKVNTIHRLLYFIIFTSLTAPAISRKR